MKEKTLLRIALIITIIGLGGLFYISDKIEVSEKSIGKITAENVDEMVKVQGVVSRITVKGNLTIIEITQPEKIPVFIFDNVVKPKEGDTITVYGKVQEYEGKMEIIGDVVRRYVS